MADDRTTATASLRRIREELFLSPRFDPYSTGGFSLETLLGPLRPATVDEIREALRALVDDGLAEEWTAGASGEPSYRATEKGWLAREEWLRAQGLRHSVFEGQYAGPAEHAVLALLAASVIESESTPPGYLAGDGSISEPLLTFFSDRCCTRDLPAVIERLTSKGLVRAKGEGRLVITAMGRREYEDVVVPALRIPQPSTILSLQRIGGVSLFSTTLPNDLARNLQSRWTEAALCQSAGAYLAATLMYASVAEGILVRLIRERWTEAAAAPSAPKNSGKTKRPETWRLVDMVRVAKEVGWFDATLGGFVDQLRNVRNLVHPWKQIEEGAVVDHEICSLARRVAEKASDALASLMPKL